MEKTGETPTHRTKYALTFIQPTSGLKIGGNAEIDEGFCPLFNVTNNRAKISKLLGSDIALVMGMHFHDSTRGADAVIYLEGDISQTDQELSQLSVDQFVHYAMEFLLSLWLVKDHAVDLLPAVLRISHPTKRNDYRILTFGQSNFDRYGRSGAVEFTREEIRNACEYNQDLVQKLTRANPEENASVVRSRAATNFEGTSSRLLRFLSLLEKGRNMPDVGIKLGLFCSCLECLFSKKDTNTEVTHRVAEKAAFLLGSNPVERKDIYKRVQQAYDMRSSVLHGGTIRDKDLSKLPEVSSDTDSILRKVFTKIILNPDLLKLFTEDETRLQEMFLELLFSGTAKEISADSILHPPSSP